MARRSDPVPDDTPEPLTAFETIFIRHNASFLLDHASARVLAEPDSRVRLGWFVADAERRGGVHDIRQTKGDLLLHYQFPLSLSAIGEMRAEGTGPRVRIVLQMRVIGEPGEWKIDNIFGFTPGLAR